jgi:curved DNA-binding protein CbpA
MSYPFELLGLAKRPLLSEEEIGTAYRKLAATLHPDQAGGDAARFKDLGEAVAILRDPARRLRSLNGVTAGTLFPPEAVNLFPRIAILLQTADDLITRRTAASNPLAKAVLAAPLKKLVTDLDALLKTIREWRSDLDAHLAALDADWPGHDPEAVAHLADSFSYATRWESQLRERRLSLDCL